MKQDSVRLVVQSQAPLFSRPTSPLANAKRGHYRRGVVMSWFSAKVSGVRTAKVVIDRAIGSDWGPDWISDLTNENAAEDFIKSVDDLGKLDRIDIEINSPGGDVASGLRIMNYLIEHPAQVHVKVTGMAASIAAIVMLAGDKRSMGIGTSI